jgi:hypothetical protein
VVGQRRNGKLLLHTYWFIPSYEQVNGNSLIALHCPPACYMNKIISKLTALIATCITLITFLDFSSALQMEATHSSKMSGGFQQSKWYCTPKDRSLQGGESTIIPHF